MTIKELSPLTFSKPISYWQNLVSEYIYKATQYISLCFWVTQEFLLFGKASVENEGSLEEAGEENIFT